MTNMFIAHAPTGYLLAKVVYKGNSKAQLILLMSLVAGSLLPDLDLVYFYFIDHRAHNHHAYWTHIPVYWLLNYCVALALAFALDNYRLLLIATAVFIGIMLHLLLDTFTGGIRWEYPFSNKYYAMVSVPALHNWWVLNFVLHWTFVVEVILVGLAAYRFSHSRSGSTPRSRLNPVKDCPASPNIQNV